MHPLDEWTVIPQRKMITESKLESKSVIPPSLAKRRVTSSLGRKKGRHKKGKAQANLPPMRNLAVTVRHTFRFRSAGFVAVSCSVTDLLGACGGICYTANSLLRTWASSVRVHKMTIWPDAAGEVTINWATPVTGIEKDVMMNEDLPTGVTLTGAVVSKPPAKSLCGSWLQSSTANIFIVNSTAGCIMDVDLEFTLSATLLGTAITIATGTLGTIYYLALDGPSQNNLVPVGLVTTS